MVQLLPRKSAPKGYPLEFPYRDGDGFLSELTVTLYRRGKGANKKGKDLMAILDGDEFVRKTRLLRLLDIGHLPGRRTVDALAIPPGYGDRCRNEKYFGAGDEFDNTIDEVTHIIHHVLDNFYDGKINTLMVVGSSLTGRAALDLTAHLSRINMLEKRFQKIKVAAIAPSFWQFYQEPLEAHLHFMISKWWLHNRSSSIEEEIQRRSAMVRRRNRALIQHLAFLREAYKFLLISYTELMRFSGDYPGENIEEVIEKIRLEERPRFPNLRKFLRLFVPDDRIDDWTDYLRWRLVEFTSEAGRMGPKNYDVFHPDNQVCNIIYEDGHTWSRWAHLFKQIVDPQVAHIPNIFSDEHDDDKDD